VATVLLGIQRRADEREGILMSEYTSKSVKVPRGRGRSGFRWAGVIVAAALMLGFSAVITAGPAMAAAPPANDDIANATPVTAVPFTATQDSLTATQGPSDPTPSCGATSGSSVWYSYTPTADGTILAETSGGDLFPPLITAYAGPPNATAASPLTEAGCSTRGLLIYVTSGTT
jgi:hypothetical protein